MRFPFRYARGRLRSTRPVDTVYAPFNLSRLDRILLYNSMQRASVQKESTSSVASRHLPLGGEGKKKRLSFLLRSGQTPFNASRRHGLRPAQLVPSRSDTFIQRASVQKESTSSVASRHLPLGGEGKKKRLSFLLRSGQTPFNASRRHGLRPARGALFCWCVLKGT